LSDLLRKRGAIPIEIPAIAILPPSDWAGVDRAIRELPTYDWLILTSRNGVRCFWERLAHNNVRSLPDGIRVAAIGEKTARALEKQGVGHPVTPRESLAAEELAEALIGRHSSWSGRSVLIPRAERGREVLPQALRERGARVDTVIAYRTVPARENGSRLRDLVRGHGADWVSFASGSAVEAVFNLLDGTSLEGVRIAAIGRVTARALEERGVSADVVSPSSSLEAMVEAMNQVG
jgi:uroporphyrinogen III methyltransferase/synthase